MQELDDQKSETERCLAGKAGEINDLTGRITDLNDEITNLNGHIKQLEDRGKEKDQLLDTLTSEKLTLGKWADNHKKELETYKK